jgi:glucosamine 6-phosphate synthetase-like amidotransferase/phosphosugar isomerase protein
VTISDRLQGRPPKSAAWATISGLSAQRNPQRHHAAAAGNLPHRFHTVSSHTRWASVGAINEANCHPLDNRTPDPTGVAACGPIHVCLNGDIDNYRP